MIELNWDTDVEQVIVWTLNRGWNWTDFHDVLIVHGLCFMNEISQIL